MTFEERMDRITEKHEALAQTVQLLAGMFVEAEKRSAEYEKRNGEAHDKHERDMADIRLQLRRAIRLGIQEARTERRRRQEMDARFELKMDQLAGAHLLTEEGMRNLQANMDAFIESMRRSTNGRSSS